MSKALQAARNFDDAGINADLIDLLDSTDFERYLGVPSSDDQVLASKIDGTREWITVSSIIEWGDIQGTLSNQTDLWNELQNRYTKSETFSQAEHISLSNGQPDAGKPIVLNGQGQIDPSMIDVSTFYYVGVYDPSDASNPNGEYPDITNETHGAFWAAVIVANPDNPGDPVEDAEYTFSSGDLVGKTISTGDFMIYGTAGWSIMASEMNPLAYYRLDGSQSITAPFAGGGQTISNIADGIVDTDAASIAQLNTKADLTYVDSELLTKVSKTGDTMTGGLIIDDGGIGDAGFGVSKGPSSANIKWNYFELRSDTHHFRIEDDFTNVEIDFKFDDDTSMSIGPFSAPKTKYAPTEVNHLTRKDYVDTKESNLGNPTADGQILSSDTSGNRTWIDAPDSAVWGQISGTLSNQTDLWNELTSLAKTDGSRNFTGDVTFEYDIFVGSNGTGNSIINFYVEDETDYTAYIQYDQVSNKIQTNVPLYSSKFISSGGTIRTGYNANNNSVYEFTDPSGPEIPTIFWHNINKDFYVDTNTTLDLRLYHEGNANLIPISDDVQNALDNKENHLGNPNSNGMVLSSDTAGNRSWITPPQGVTEHNLLNGRDANDAHPISSITDLQDSLDNKSDINHNHDTVYVLKDGDTMTGNLTLSNTAPVVVLRDTDDGKESRIANYPSELQIQTDKANVIFAGTLGGAFGGEVYIKKSDGTHSFYHGGNDGAGSGLDADLLDGQQGSWYASQDDLAQKPDISEIYLRNEFIDYSSGVSDAGKPIVLNSQGQIDPSMIDVSAFYYVGPWTPTSGNEYPDTTGETPGAFWVVQGVSDTGYEFTDNCPECDLLGQTVTNGDFMVWAAGGWSIMVGEMNPLLYMKLDKSTPFDNNGNPLIVNGNIQNVSDGVNPTDAATVGQSVQKIGDTMSGNLEINKGNIAKSVITDYGVEVHSQDDSNQVEIIYDTVTQSVDFKFNADTSLTANNQAAPSTKYSPTEVNHLTRKDYVDAGLSQKADQSDLDSHINDTNNPHNVTYDQTGAEANLGNPTSDGEVLTSLSDGTRQWKTVQDIVPTYPSMIRQRFIGDGATTTFSIIESYTPNNADVFYNGVKILTPEDVDISSGTEIVFTIAPENGDIIEFVGYKVPVTVDQPTP